MHRVIDHITIASTLAFACFMLLLSPMDSLAEPDGLACLKRAQGDTLFWSGKWQSDNRDENVEYQILHVSERYDKGVPAITLELSAISSANRPFRYVSVADPKIAKGLCSRLSSRRKKNGKRVRVTTKGRSSGLSLSGIREESTVKKTINKQDTATQKAAEANARPPYPFISFSTQGWVRSEARSNSKFWDTCSTMGRKFTCLKSEKEQYKNELNKLNLEAKAIKGL